MISRYCWGNCYFR